MQGRKSWLAVLALVASLAFMQCGSSSATDAGTGGGTGGGGVDAGSGGGVGGGTGGGTVVDAGCEQVSFPASSYRAANHVAMNGQNPPYDWALFAVPGATANHFAVFGVELWFFGASENPTFPYTVTLGPTTYGTCESCLTYQEGCDSTGVNCTTFFLAQAGTVTYTKADKDPSMGRFTGSGTNIRFAEWNELGDRPKTGGRCVELASFTMDGFWPRPMMDAGTDGGSDVDGGVDAGTDSDAGMDTDAGTDAGMTDAG